MGILSYIIWNGSPVMFSVWRLDIRWYGLLFMMGFLISQQILYYIHKQENKPERDVETLTIYMVIATIIGARLGHVIFYSPHLIWDDPLSIFIPFKFNPLRFTGLQGLASHGGAFGILFALWLYSRKKKPGQSYLQVVDRIVILVAITGALIRIGNYFNSEIVGLPTSSPWGVVFVNNFSEQLEETDRQKSIESIEFRAVNPDAPTTNGRVPLNIYVLFRPGTSPGYADQVLKNGIGIIENEQSGNPNFDVSSMPTAEMSESGAVSTGRIQTVGIARHPAQLYESIACIILALLLFSIWFRYKNDLPPGRLLGIFLIWCFGLRFLFEYLKEVQVSFENDMLSNLGLNMGQILSIPLFLAGIVILVLSYRKKA